jgi:tetraacyldisaccharide 4'-kinase
MIVTVRRSLYRNHLLQSHRFNVPVIVVGNITVGGTGKTPFAIWLSGWLVKQGYQNPGIVSRGVGSIKHSKPFLVKPDSSVLDAGDEAVLMARKTLLPVVVYPDRVKAVQYLLDQCACDVVICDDGLQHYRLARDMEIAIIDGRRRFGNSELLPAGPLREPESRLREVNLAIVNGGNEQDDYSFSIVPVNLVRVNHVYEPKNIRDFNGQTVHAVAGIGNPDRFFTLLEELGMTIVKHVFPDHHAFQANDLKFNDDFPIVMTEKDAVKCMRFAPVNCWYLDISISPNNKFQESLLSQLKK